MIDIIYCAAGNKRYAQIAIDEGWLYGGRLPASIYHPPYFTDQEYKNPDRVAYMKALAQHRPKIATVLDWEHDEQLPEILSWAEQAAEYVQESIILIPKVRGGIKRLPRRIGGKDVRLGYSVPTSYGATDVAYSEFTGWDVHLLGGAPHVQMRIARKHIKGVVSADTNYFQKLANKNCQFWQPGSASYAQNRYFPKLVESDGQKWGDGGKKAGANYEAFRRSCIAIRQAWRGEPITLWGNTDQLRLF